VLCIYKYIIKIQQMKHNFLKQYISKSIRYYCILAQIYFSQEFISEFLKNIFVSKYVKLLFFATNQEKHGGISQVYAINRPDIFTRDILRLDNEPSYDYRISIIS